MKKNRRSVTGLALAAAAAVLALGLPALARLWVDVRWFEDLGHPDVLWTPLKVKVGLGVACGLAVFAVLAISLKIALRLSERGRRGPVSLSGLSIGDEDAAVQIDIAQAVSRLALPLSAVVGVLAGLAGAGGWQRWLMATHGGSFGRLDPLFGRDVGFYVFALPLLDAVFSFAFWTLAITLLLTFGVYLARGALRLEQGRPRATRAARAHLSVLGALLFGLLAYGAWLSSAHLVLSQGGLVAGAGYTDVHARLPMIRAHMVIAILGAALVAVSATRRRLVLVFVAVGLYVVAGVLGRGLYPPILQTYVVEPNELERERPFIEHEITATRDAYGVSDVTERELGADPSLSWADIEANRETIDNIRVWDHRPLLDTFGQVQEIRTYYDFVSVDNDRYVIDGRLRQTMLSPRELSSESLPNRTWINEHFTFTHGYGLTLGPVNEATDEGLPVLFVRDIPPVSTLDPQLAVERPQIYFGELTNDYVFVDTASREFDHPSGEGNVYGSFEGDTGLSLDSALFRAALAVELGSLKIVLSDDLTDASRVLMRRRVTERVAQLAPFLVLDQDPYLVVREDGSLAWILDAYTTTDRYPYSKRASGSRLSYIRNSVKAVVDAYDGSVTLYVADEDDPLLAAWRSVFPELFTPLSEIPSDLRAHLRYPLDIFHVQAHILATFHMDSPELLYNREDQWQVPSLRRGRITEPVEPYYTVMRLPGEDEAEFILMLPFTPARKDNLAAWMVARSDGEHLGELVVYEFPNDRLIYGPQQVLNRISQDAEISAQLSLWDQRGSQADLGTLLVIPIEESLIYVLPLYLRSEGGRIPQLKRVIVVYENRIAMRETLDLAIAEVFGRAERAPDPLAAVGEDAEPQEAVEDRAEAPAAAVAAAEAAGADTDDLRVLALRHFRRAVAAQRRGDWAGYGEELARVEELLQRIQPQGSPEPAPTEPAPTEPAPTEPGEQAAARGAPEPPPGAVEADEAAP